MSNKIFSQIPVCVIIAVFGCNGPDTPDLAERDGYLDAAIAMDGNTESKDLGSSSDLNVTDTDIQIDASMNPTQSARRQCGNLSYQRHIQEGNTEDGWHISGTTDFGDGNAGSCGGLGSESMIKFRAPAAGIYTLQAVTETGSLPVLYVRTNCESETSEVACTASSAQANKITLSFTSETREEWYIFVDTWQPSGRTDFSLFITYAENQQAPVINAASMLRMNTTLQIKLSAQDTNADIATGRVFDENGSSLVEFPFYSEEVQPANMDQIRTFNVAPPNQDAGQLYVTLTDLNGLESASVRLEEGVIINADNGDACGQSVETFTRCPPNSLCSQINKNRSECVTSTPPAIASFRVFQGDRGHRCELIYSDINADVAFGIIELMDDGDAVLEIHAFPLPDQGTELRHVLELPRQSDTFPSKARLIITDDQNQESAPLFEMIELPEVLSSRSACEPTDISTQCIENERCLEDCELEDNRCIPRCVNKLFPTLTNAVAIRNLGREQLYLELNIDDPQRVFERVRVSTSTEIDLENELEPAHWIRSSDSGLKAITTSPLPTELGNVAVLTVVPEDTEGNLGQAIDVTIEPPTIIEENAPCDPSDIRRTCDIGQACIGDDRAMTCSTSIASIIRSGILYVDENRMRLGLSADVDTGDAEVSTLIIQYRSLTNDSITTRAFPLTKTVPARSTSTIQQRINVLPNTEIEAIALQDIRYVRSEWQPIATAAPPTLSLDSQCPIDELFGRCTEEATCLPTANGDNRCIESPQGCPDSWSVDPLIETNGITSSQGDTREGVFTELGSCNLGDKGVIHLFSPAADVSYTVKVIPSGASPIRYPRIAVFDECGLTETELSCTQSAGIVYPGQANNSVFIVVSAPPIGDNFHGTYDIEVTQHQRARIEDASLMDTEVSTAKQLTIVFSPGSEAITSVSIRPLDSTGEPLWAQGAVDSWTQGVSVSNESRVQATTVIDFEAFDEPLPYEFELRLVDEFGVSSLPFRLRIP